MCGAVIVVVAAASVDAFLFRHLKFLVIAIKIIISLIFVLIVNFIVGVILKSHHLQSQICRICMNSEREKIIASIENFCDNFFFFCCRSFFILH